MKKIMFNDKYGLTQAVLEKRKTQTRRIITYPKTFKGQYVAGFHVYKRKSDGTVSEICMYDEDERDFDSGQIVPMYKVNEVVAIAQKYSLAINPVDWVHTKIYEDTKAWNNKMYVRPDLMPHQIRITNVRIERLQDISDNDCLAEGIKKINSEDGTPRYYVKDWKGDTLFATYTPQNAYAFLIDKVGKKGDWDSNPYVFVYDFELLK